MKKKPLIALLAIAVVFVAVFYVAYLLFSMAFDLIAKIVSLKIEDVITLASIIIATLLVLFIVSFIAAIAFEKDKIRLEEEISVLRNDANMQE